MEKTIIIIRKDFNGDSFTEAKKLDISDELDVKSFLENSIIDILHTNYFNITPEEIVDDIMNGFDNVIANDDTEIRYIFLKDDIETFTYKEIDMDFWNKQ